MTFLRQPPFARLPATLMPAQEYASAFLANGYDDLLFLQEKLQPDDLDTLAISNPAHRRLLLRESSAADGSTDSKPALGMQAWLITDS